MVKSIRWRLQLWHAGLLVVVIAGLGSGLYYHVRQARIDDVDAELHAAARAVEGTMKALPPHILEGMPEPFFPDRPPPGPPPRLRNGDPGRPPPPRDRPPPRRLERELTLPGYFEHRFGDPASAPYFVVWLANGAVLKASPLPPETSPPERPQPSSASGNEPFAVRQRGQLREVIVVGPYQSQVLVGRLIEHETSELDRLAWHMALIGLGVLTVGLAGGWLLSRGAVRPIQAMSATAVAISASNLGRRIEVASLDRELGKLAATLNATFDRLESAFVRQVRFTADASHELRTPLSVVHSHAELALARPRSPEEYREALDTCLRASRRMKAIVEGLLTLARADAGKLEMKHELLDLGALAGETADLLHPLAAAREIGLTVSAPSTRLIGDAGRLAQVVTNLLSNAIHYNRPGGAVRLTVTTENHEAILAIADTGYGIPEADRGHIFERFFRVDKARSREVAGSGLGLAICQSIVEAHRGSIAFTTALDQGTTFVVRLPIG